MSPGLSSRRATVLYFAQTQVPRHDEARVYDGCRIEWGRRVDVPVER